MTEIIRCTPDEINIDAREVAVYLSYFSVKNDESINSLMCGCNDEFLKAANFNACFAKVPVKIDSNCVDLGFMKTESKSLRKNLTDCDYAYILAATTGINAHRLIERNSVISPLKGIVTDCIGSASIEAFCDKINSSFENSEFLRPRFSPGYGDLPLSFQKNITDFLQTSKNIGMSLTESLMMIPVKSVTAIIGIGTEKNKCSGPGCMICKNDNCPYR